MTSSRVAAPVTSKRAPPRSLATARTVPPFGEAVGDRVIDALRDNGIERVVAEDGNLDVDE